MRTSSFYNADGNLGLQPDADNMKKICKFKIKHFRKDKLGKWYLAHEYFDTKGYSQKGDTFEWICLKLKKPVIVEYSNL